MNSLLSYLGNSLKLAPYLTVLGSPVKLRRNPQILAEDFDL